MSRTSYHEQKWLVIPNISLALKNATFPSITAWNTLNPYHYYIYGKAFRFQYSDTASSNLLLVYELYDDTRNVDSKTATIILVLVLGSLSSWILFFFVWRTSFLHGSLRGNKNRAVLRTWCSRQLFRLYGVFGLVEKQLNVAARHGNLSDVQACLKRGADVNCTDNMCFVQRFLQLFCVLLGFVLFFFFGPFLWISGFHSFIFPSLVGDKETPLMLAAKNCHFDVVTSLLQNGADVTDTNVRGDTAFDLIEDEMRYNFSKAPACIEIMIALINADPSWKSSQLFYNRWQAKPIIDVLRHKIDRILLFAGIPLTLERVSEDHNKLLFLIIEMNLHDYEYKNDDGSIHDEKSKSSFDTLKDHIRILVKDYPDLIKAQDKDGRMAVDVASKPMQELLQSVWLWHGRYRITELRPEHVSATCLVFKAIDEQIIDEQTREPIRVALKLMRIKAQFERELTARDKEFSPEHVINVLQTFPTPSTMSSMPEEVIEVDINVDAGLQLNKEDAEKLFLLAMPLADRNLFVALKQERWAGKNFEVVQSVFKQLVHCVEHMHDKGVLHADLKTLNIVRTGGQWKLIDLDATCIIGVDKVGHKSSSAYVPPEAIHIAADTACVRSITAVTKGEANYELLTAHPSFDVWSLGCILYQMCTPDVKPLFQGGQDDNLVGLRKGVDNLFALAEWSPELKADKLADIPDKLARNLLSQMLHKNPLQRPSLARVFGHPFLSGKKVARLVGDKPKYDVFLSYRVASDAHHVEKLYNLLTASPHNLKVYWDKLCLKPGVDWEQGFCEGLVSSRTFVPLLSRDAINHPDILWQNFSTLTADSRCDNVFLEHRLAVELQGLGLIEEIFPVFIGNLDTVTSEYSNYFGSGCHPSLSEVRVKSVEEKVRHHMESQALGTPIVPDRTVKSVVDAITACQGAFILGPADATFAAAAKTIIEMVKAPPVIGRIDSTMPIGVGVSTRGHPTLVNSTKQTPEIARYNTSSAGMTDMEKDTKGNLDDSIRIKPQPLNIDAKDGLVVVSNV